MESNKLWKLVSEDLQVSLTEPQFNGFIATLDLLKITSVGEDRLIIRLACPSSFHRGILDQRFFGQITDAFNRISKKQCELNIEVHHKKRAKRVTEQEDTQLGPLFSHSTDSFDEYSVAMQRIGLGSTFTFDSFAVSSSNEMAHAAALAAADNFGKAYNPLFIYGGVGVGKTHLTQAVAIRHLTRKPNAQMVFCMSEEFTNGIIEAIQQKTTRQFRERYRKVEGLFIDDIQFIAGKNTVQEEFFHTFNAVVKAGGQVVMTSDRPPAEIKNLEARLRSRFEAGLLVDIGEPGFELRTAITLIKAKQRSIELSVDQARLIAGNIESARQIEGFLTKITTESTLRKQPISEGFIRSILNSTSSKIVPDIPPPLRPHEVIKGVSSVYNLTPKEVRGARRVKQVVKARHIAMYLLRVDYKLPFAEIGSLFSNRDHTSVMHAVEKIMRQLTDSESLRMDVSQVRNSVYTH